MRARATKPNGKRHAEADSVDQLPPHDERAEAALLGCVLLDPVASREWLETLPPEAFYLLKHRWIFETLVEMQKADEAIDLITLQARLRTGGRLEEIGGLPYLAGLPEATPCASNFGVYVDIILSCQTRRAMLRFAVDVQTGIREGQSDIEETFERQWSAIRLSFGDSPVILDNKTLVEDLIVDWEAGDRAAGINSGFYDFDRMTGGLKPGQLVIIAARPSVGKTSLAVNMADHAAITCSVPTLFFSLEMTGKEIAERFICSSSRVDANRIRAGALTEGEFKRVTTAQIAFKRAPLRIVDKGGLSLAQLSGLARSIADRHGVQLIVIDYMGLVRSGQRNHSRYEEVTAVSIGLKGLAKELNVPLVALAQLNRDSDREERPPRLSDLRDSGSIEQDGDIVCLLHRDGDPVSDVQRIKLNVAKHRNGPTGVVQLQFYPRLTRFESTANNEA